MPSQFHKTFVHLETQIKIFLNGFSFLFGVLQADCA